MNPILPASATLEVTGSQGNVTPDWTFGPKWDSFFSWADRHQIRNDALILVDVALIHDRHDIVGSVLKAASSPTAKFLFESWSDQSVHAESLLRIAEAATWDSSVFQHYRPQGYAVPAKSHFKKTVERYYLAALCVARTPVPSSRVLPATATWFEVLRAWALVHAVSCYLEKGIRLEESLQLVCGRLRAGSDDDKTRWLDAVKHLSCSLSDCRHLSQLDFHLTHRVEAITRRQRELALDTGQVDLLKAVKAVASNLYYELKLDSGALPLPATWHTHVPEPRSMDAQPWILPGSDVESATPHADLIPGSSDSESATRLPIRHVSLTHQRLTDQSVLIASAEQVNFLPWSWTVPQAHERNALAELSKALLQSTVIQERLLGVMVKISVQVGRSLRRALDIRIAECAGPEWTWLAERESLERLSPRRPSGWLPKTDEQRTWIKPEQPTQSISLEPEVRAALGDIFRQAPSAHCLGDLWAAFGQSTPEAAFSEAVRSACPRVTPGMLGQVLTDALLRITRDATFVRLGTAHPRSALPGACAYPTWSTAQVADAISKTVPPLEPLVPPSAFDDSAMGSLLAVLEERLPGQFQSAAHRIDAHRARLHENQGNDASTLANFHNAYAGYLVMLLLAATGARPVKDPFESFFDFDFANATVFISDKSQGAESEGRMVPIPRSLAGHIVGDYLAHLEKLASLVATAAPHLSSKILGLAQRKEVAAIPLFFLLTADEHGLEWTTISESRLQTLGLFDWPLPFNLFRHRLATRLRDLGLDAEIIDGLLGHSESGAESYGDGSWRTWSSDMKVAHPALERLFASLHAPYPRGVPDGLFPLTSPTRSETAEVRLSALYGRAARSARREEWQRDTKSAARVQLKQLIAGRAISELSTESLDEIGKKLLFNQKGLPHRRGWIQYRHFLRVLERHGQLTGKRSRLTRYYARLDTHAPFTDLAPRARAGLFSIRQHLEAAIASHPPRSFMQSALYGALLLATESSIADLGLLQDILRGDHWRVVRLADQLYLEFATDLDPEDPDAPVRRIRISPRAAECLANASERKAAPRSGPQPIPEYLLDLANAAAPFNTSPIEDWHGLLNAIAAAVDQVNAMEYPGAIAGLLAGRNESWALSVRDQARLLTGSPIDFPVAARAIEDESQGQAITLANITAGEEAAISAARQFLRQFRSRLRTHKSHDKPSEQDTTDDTVTASRRDLRRALERLVKEHSGRVSPAVLLLATWATTHITRKKKGRYVALPSILRYLGALALPLIELAPLSDLRSMDEGELTQLYEEVLASGTHDRPDYRYERLRAFQRWCEAHHEVVAPDWSELPCFSGKYPPNAGIILEEEYQRALSQLIAAASPQRRESLAPALVLLFCYRFGLRGREATGLRRDEWLDMGNLKLVIVQTNSIRRSKTPDGSRRVVPLLFELSAKERELLRAWFGSLEAIAGDKRSVPIFCDDAGQALDHNRVCELARVALKSCTGNPNTVLHHARHTAGTVVAVALGNLALPGSERLSQIPGGASQRKVQSLLLGFPGVSRRSPWAVARYLGHTGIDRARITYLHFLWDWANSLVWRAGEPASTGTAGHGIWDLDALPRLPVGDTDTQLSGQVAFIPCIVDILKAFRLLARGCEWKEAADRLMIPTAAAKDWADFVDSADRRLRLHGEPILPEPSHSVRFLTHLGESAWQRLIAHAHRQPVSKDQGVVAYGGTAMRRHDVVEMIGASRQWLMWKCTHFQVTRAAVDYWDIEKSRQVVVATDKAFIENTFRSIATETGFEISSQPRPGKKKLQMDVAYEQFAGLTGSARVAERCALVIQESADGTVRNSYEWLVAVAAWSLATSFTERQFVDAGNESIEQLKQQLAAAKQELEEARQSIRRSSSEVG